MIQYASFKCHKGPHHFTLPYFPWSKEAVERLGKELVEDFCSITSELQMTYEEWSDLLPQVQSAHNNAPAPQHANIAPITEFKGMDLSPPISTYLRSSTTTVMLITDVQRKRMVQNPSLQSKIADLHPVVQNALQLDHHRISKATSWSVLPNFVTGL